MHQKGTQERSGFESYNGFDDEDDDEIDDDEDDDGRNVTDPFADVDDDDLDDDLDEDEPQMGSAGRGSWWRDVVRGGGGGGLGAGTGSAPHGLTEQDDSDDEEFGDFAMAEDEKGSSSVGGRTDGSPEKVLLKPLAVNPMKEAARGLSGLWPFGSRAETTTTTSNDDGEVVVSTSAGGGVGGTASDEEEDDDADNGGERPVEAKEGLHRMSIDEDDDEEVVVNVSAGSSSASQVK